MEASDLERHEGSRSHRVCPDGRFRSGDRRRECLGSQPALAESFRRSRRLWDPRLQNPTEASQCAGCEQSPTRGENPLISFIHSPTKSPTNRSCSRCSHRRPVSEFAMVARCFSQITQRSTASIAAADVPFFGQRSGWPGSSTRDRTTFPSAGETKSTEINECK